MGEERKIMPATKVKTRWTSGNLEWLDASGNIIATWDGTNRKLTFPSGSALDLSAATGILSLAAGEIAAADLADAILTGQKAAVVANANVIGGIPVVHQIDITAGALGNTDVTLTYKTRIIDAWLVLRGAGVASTTLQVKNGTNAITDAMAASGADQALVRAASIDDAYHEIAAGGTLRVTSATGATQPDATVYVIGYRVA
jgi:hypothetical protein